MLRHVLRAASRCNSTGLHPAPSGSTEPSLQIWGRLRQAWGMRQLAGWAPGPQSIESSIEELNEELAGYFGDATPHLSSADRPKATPSAEAAQSYSSEISSPIAEGGGGRAAAELESQAAALNLELREFFGPAASELLAGAAAVEPGPSPDGPLSSGGGGRGGRGSKSSTQLQHSAESSSNSNRRRGSSSSSSSSVTNGCPQLTHVDETGKAAMVDVSQKAATVRSATATARVLLGPEVFQLVAGNQLNKGDVLTVAQLAGVIGAKYTSHLIPLCHNIMLSKVGVELRLAPHAHAVDITALAKTVGPTGVEMEALTAASVAALTVYDMVKAASKDVVITDIRLEAKSGGRSGKYQRQAGGSGGE